MREIFFGELANFTDIMTQIQELESKICMI